MAAARWTLENPEDSSTYEWPVNPSEEEAISGKVNIEFSANTSDGLVQQQGDPEPVVLAATGKILTKAQLTTMLTWKALCKTQTLYLTDHAGDQYEGTITDFTITRKRTLKNPQDFANSPYWFWEYRFEFTPIRAISGPWQDLIP